MTCITKTRASAHATRTSSGSEHRKRSANKAHPPFVPPPPHPHAPPATRRLCYFADSHTHVVDLSYDLCFTDGTGSLARRDKSSGDACSDHAHTKQHKCKVYAHRDFWPFSKCDRACKETLSVWDRGSTRGAVPPNVYTVDARARRSPQRGNDAACMSYREARGICTIRY